MSRADDTDVRFMMRAISLAEKGIHTARPNPCVGCVAVRDGEVIAEGWHRARGKPHAEIAVLSALKQPSSEVALYVTLEPCVHQGRTPPCVERIIECRPAKVVAAMEDPNPLVSGKGFAAIRNAGIKLEVGVCESEARWLVRGHAARMGRSRPWVTLKLAATLDGKTALTSGLSKWITSEQSRRDVQDQRAQACAVMTGSGTALQDDPRLNVREFEVLEQPLKVLVDSRLRSGPDMAMFHTGRTLVATAQPPAGEVSYPDGVEVVPLPDGGGRVDLAALLDLLGERECNRLLVEAGARLSGALLEQGLVDEVLIYIAPTVFGAGKDLFAITPPASPESARRLTLREVKTVGGDIKATFLADGA